MALSWITLKNAESHWKVLLYRSSAAGTQSIKSFRGKKKNTKERLDKERKVNYRKVGRGRRRERKDCNGEMENRI